MELNENDKKLIGFCSVKKRSIGELAKLLNIAPKNISVRLPKLEKEGHIKTEKQGQGKKTLVSINDDKEVKKNVKLILKELKEKGGEISEEDFLKLPTTIEINKDNQPIISKAKMLLLYTHHDLFERRIRITPTGEQFLKEN